MASEETELEAHELQFQEIQSLNRRRHELKVRYAGYVKKHPEIKTLLNDFMCAALLEKPDNIIHFGREHFLGVAPLPPRLPEYYAPLVLFGPSGVGKRTLLKHLQTQFPNTFVLPIQHTSRLPIASQSEVNGKHFHFVSKDTMTSDIEHGKFISHETIKGTLYGISYAAVEKVVKDKKICTLCVSLDTMQRVCKAFAGTNAVLIRPASVDDFENRLKKTVDDERVRNQLLHTAETMLHTAEELNVEHRVVNAVEDHAAAELGSLVPRLYPHLDKLGGASEEK